MSALILLLMMTISAVSASTAPSLLPTTINPSIKPTIQPSVSPTTISPSIIPTRAPSALPSISRTPTVVPTVLPSIGPTISPSRTPTVSPSFTPSVYLSAFNWIFLSAGKSAGATSSSGTGGKATAANFVGPRSIYQTTTGLMYVEDGDANCIRTYNPMTDNIVKAYAGVCGSSGDTRTGAATSGKFYTPFGIMGDTTGNIYFPELNNHNVKKVDTSGILSLVAGTGNTGTGGLGGQATSADFGYPHDIFLDSTGVIFIPGYYNCQVRAIATNGITTLIAGIYTANAFKGDGGPATSAKLNSPVRIRCDTTGVLFISDADNARVRKVTTDGIINTYAGTGITTSSGENVAVSSANINYPVGLWTDSAAGDFYIADSGFIKWLYIPGATQTVNTYAGSGVSGNTGNGGAATSCTFNDPQSMVLDTNGNSYVLDYGNSNVRVIYSVQPTASPTIVPTAQPSVLPSRGPSVIPSIAPSAAPSALPSVSMAPSVSPTGAPTTAGSSSPSSARSAVNNIDTFAGTGTSDSTGSGGLATAASLYYPRVVWGTTNGIIYISENTGNCIRQVDTSLGIIQVYAGVCASATNALINSAGSSGDGGPSTAALLNSPVGLFVSSTGAMYIADYKNSKIRSVSTNNIMSLIAGTQAASSNSGDGGTATAAGVYGPTGVWCDSTGVLYVSSYLGNVVRAVSMSNIISTFAGKPFSFYFSDFLSICSGTGSSATGGDGGLATSAGISAPQRVLGDSTGKIYVTDESAKRVRVISASQSIITAFIGLGTSVYQGEGVAATSQGIDLPMGIQISANNGDFYVVSSNSNRVFVMTGSTGMVTTFVGTGTSGSTGDGGAASSALVNNADGIYLDPSNNKLYVADSGNYKVRVVYSVSPTIAPSVVPSRAPSSVPSVLPSLKPSQSPTAAPSASPSALPSEVPSIFPSVEPTMAPSISMAPSVSPSVMPSVCPTTAYPTVIPTLSPTSRPTVNVIESKYPSYKVKNALAFAGISNGTLMAWGLSSSGGDCSSVSALVVNVTKIIASKYAFAALSGDGIVVAWGNSRQIAGWSSEVNGLIVKSLAATEQAFAGVTSEGAVVAFGAGCCGGNVSQYGDWSDLYLSKNVESVRASAGAFCALKTDGTVYCWGSEFAGGGVSSISRTDLVDIVSLTSTRSAFAALISDGSVVVWGCAQFGGILSNSMSVKLSGSTEYIVSNSASFTARTTNDGFLTWGSIMSESTGTSLIVESVAHTADAFAVVQSNGSVISWGNVKAGGGVSLASSFKSVVGNNGAFAAVSSSGLVTAWGSSFHGGELNTELDNVDSVYYTTMAFAALKYDGSIVAWGSESGGGSVPDDIASYVTSEVRLLCANDVAFTAILNSGIAVVWGHSSSIGNPGVLGSNYQWLEGC